MTEERWRATAIEERRKMLPGLNRGEVTDLFSAMALDVTADIAPVCGIVAKYQEAYTVAQNDLVASRLRRDRARELRDALPAGRASSMLQRSYSAADVAFPAVITTLTTTSSGEAVLAVRPICDLHELAGYIFDHGRGVNPTTAWPSVGPEVTFTTSPGDMSAAVESIAGLPDTRIKAESPLYRKLEARQVGDVLWMVSLRLVPDERDGFVVLALTERSAMLEPSFLVVVNNVEALADFPREGTRHMIAGSLLRTGAGRPTKDEWLAPEP